MKPKRFPLLHWYSALIFWVGGGILLATPLERTRWEFIIRLVSGLLFLAAGFLNALVAWRNRSATGQ
jgi:hypothetical protein